MNAQEEKKGDKVNSFKSMIFITFSFIPDVFTSRNGVEYYCKETYSKFSSAWNVWHLECKVKKKYL